MSKWGKYKNTVLIVFISGLFMGCGGSPTPQDAPIAAVQGITIDIPSMLDTLVPVHTVPIPEDTPCFRLVSYFDAAGCTSCKLKELYIWRRLLASDSISSCLFVFNTSRMEYPAQTLSTYRFDYPMYLDSSEMFARRYPQLARRPEFHTFLLDRNNRVVLVGSPIGNPKMRELYKATIARLRAYGGVLPASQK